MNHPSTVAEYSVVESEKIHLTENQLACIIQSFLAREVDLVVLSKELITQAASLSDTIVELRNLRQQVLGTE